ncbi:MAG TPA: 50S ribosomal protein L37e [Candidatus Nanoarchaeia archaeon]|nr:50S ribosomal protein L37e [Candidatus Nanoarchaeia archaeon]
MSKGTSAHGEHGKGKSHVPCRRCGYPSFHIRHKMCAKCGYGRTTTIRRFAWAKKGSLMRRMQH